MDIQKLETLLRKCESPTIEFKKKWYGTHKLCEPDKDIRRKNWSELMKDIISLINADVGHQEENRYLIIGAFDIDPKPGENREIFDIERVGDLADTERLKTIILKSLETYCRPSYSSISINFVSMKEDKQLLVIELTPPKDVVEIIANLVTPSQTFKEGTVLYRYGQEISVANPSKIKALSNEFTNKTGFEDNQNLLYLTTIIKMIALIIFIIVVNLIPEDLALTSRGIASFKDLPYYYIEHIYSGRWVAIFVLSSLIPAYFWNIYLTPKIPSFWNTIPVDSAFIRILKAFSKLDIFLKFILALPMSILLYILMIPVFLIGFLFSPLFIFSADLIVETNIYSGFIVWLFALIILLFYQSAFWVLALSLWKLFINPSYRKIFPQD
jgi:hypothetical protein